MVPFDYKVIYFTFEISLTVFAQTDVSKHSKMTEQTLKGYFDGTVSADTLASDLKDSQVRTGYVTTSVHVIPISDNGEYPVTRQHLIKLCNDTLRGPLTMIDLNTVAFALISSDYFHWDDTTKDGEIVADTLFDWDNPEINFPLTTDNLQLWKLYLETGKYTLQADKQK